MGPARNTHPGLIEDLNLLSAEIRNIALDVCKFHLVFTPRDTKFVSVPQFCYFYANKGLSIIQTKPRNFPDHADNANPRHVSDIIRLSLKLQTQMMDVAVQFNEMELTFYLKCGTNSSISN